MLGGKGLKKDETGLPIMLVHTTSQSKRLNDISVDLQWQQPCSVLEIYPSFVAGDVDSRHVLVASRPSCRRNRILLRDRLYGRQEFLLYIVLSLALVTRDVVLQSWSPIRRLIIQKTAAHRRKSRIRQVFEEVGLSLGFGFGCWE